MLDILLYFNWTYVSVVYSEGCYGESAVEQLKLAAFNNGICVGLTLALPQHADLTEAIDNIGKLIEVNAQVVILFTYLEETRLLFSAVQQKQLVGRYHVLAFDWATQNNYYLLFEVKAKGQYWPLTCNTNHNTMFDMQAVNI